MMMILHVIRKSKFSAELAAIKISCCVVVDLSTFVTQEGAVIRLLMKEGDTDHTTLHATTITTAITITNTNTAYSANSKLTTLIKAFGVFIPKGHFKSGICILYLE